MLLATAACGEAGQFQESVGEQSAALKLSATATASSQQSASLPASAAVDGNTSTRWSSAFTDPQWIRLDLGGVKTVSRIVLRWEAAYSSSYDIQISNDAVAWTKLYTDTAGNGGVDDLAISGSGRYLQLNSYKRGTAYGSSLYEFEVYSPDTTPPPTTTPVALPARIEAEKPARFNDTTPTNLGVASCSSTAVDAQTTTDTGGGCNVAYTVAGEWLEWDVSVATAGKYDLTARLASNTTGKSVHLELDGVNVSGNLTAPSAGWQSFADVTAPGVSLTAGAHTLRLVMDTGSTNVNYLDVKAAATTPPGNVDACKRGVAYGNNSAAGLQALSQKVTWWYNWSPAPESAVRGVYASFGVEFVPMIWDETRYGGATNIPSGTKTLLGFNEPNFFSQANLSAAQAAAQWPNVQKIATDRGMKLASPGLNYCGPAASCWDTDPFHYLQTFFGACVGCQVDYVAVHWYACDLPALQHYIGQMKTTFPGKPIWLTEFACGDGADRSLAKQKAYMQSAIPYLESEPQVAKYAWFAEGNAIPNVALTTSAGALTELGQLYTSLASNSACSR
jgi:Glycosyl hydrolase catalytic core/F5/8 type C domain/DUF5010 C-terminal domain